MIGFFYTVLGIGLILGQISQSKLTPKCRSGFYYKTLPLIVDQTAILNLDNIFDGYNLNYALKGEEQWKDYLQLGQKMKLQKRQVPDEPMVGLKNYQIQRKGNSWGTSFIALTERGERSYIHYGVLNSNKSAPVINNFVEVQNFTNTTCYDAVVFPLKDVILVDCAIKMGSKDAQGYLIQNMFYYFKISDGSKIGTMKNEMYIPFEKIHKRKLQLYEDLRHSHNFLIRSYMIDGIDEKHIENTYVDVIMVSDPLDPWVIEIIDRSFLKSKSLMIVDVHVYLGQIYILDIKKGLYRVQINEEEDLLMKGFYESKGYSRFNVYSDNLDDRFQIALVNQNSVYEIDWSHIDEPKIINKYSLMVGSNISQVFINDRFLFVQSASQSEDETVYNYTWVMNRGQRTYGRAFKTIKHKTSNTFIDLNYDESFLIVIDDQQLVNYAFDKANLVLKLKRDEDFIDRMMNFTIIANSTEETLNQSESCMMILNFTLLEDNNRTMWPIGASPPSQYDANYPGKIVIPLYEYVIGPNVSYQINASKTPELNNYTIYQQEQLKIHWEKQPPLENITFLWTQTIPVNNLEYLLMYMQDTQNVTHFSQCVQNHEQINIVCNMTESVNMYGQIKNWATTIFLSRYSLQFHHVISYTTRKHYNRVYLREVKPGADEIEVQMGKGYAGNVTGVEVADKYLYIIMKYVKKIMVYDLELCLEDFCEPICEINHLMMYNLGVKYFSPESVKTSSFQPNVVFIKTSDTIIALDVNRECVPKLLAVIRPVDSALTQFSFLISYNHIVVTAVPNIVKEYDISRIYLKDVKFTKKYPLYGYKLPKSYDTDTSQFGTCIFASTLSQAGDYQIFVYRAGLPAVGTLYDIINLYTYKPVLLDASGSFIDYVTVLSAGELRIFRQYELPMAHIYNVDKNYEFWLQYYNLVIHSKLQLISVSVLNLPTNITVNPEVNDIKKTKDLLVSGPDQISQIDDDDWYYGNVLRILPDCHDCDEEVTVLNHIHEEGKVELFPGLTQYKWGSHGGTIQSRDSLIHLYHNGSMFDIVHFPQLKQQYCYSVTIAANTKYEVSACINTQGIDLYVTSFISSKGYAFQPFRSRAQQLLKLNAVNEIVMIVDSSSNPFLKTRPGGIVLYALNEDYEEQSPLEELQYIDGNDFNLEGLNELYIVNADISYHPQTLTYRLYITQILRGLLVLEFQHNTTSQSIIIVQTHYINIPAILASKKLVKPYDSTFQAVLVATTNYNPTLKKSTDVVIVTTGTYHTLQFQISYDLDNKLLSADLTKFYLRYSYYVVENYVRYHSGYVVLSQILPEDFEESDFAANKSKQLLTMYECKAQFNGTIESVGLRGAFPIQNRNPHKFDFNLTFNDSDLQRQPRVGLVVIPEFQNQYKQASLHRNLSVYTKQKVDTQIIYLDLINDFDLKKIRILLNGYSSFPEWKLITIILFSIIGFFMLLGGCLVLFKKIKERRRVLEERQSLMESEISG